MKHPENKATLVKFFITSAAMVCLPVLSFFLSKSLVFADTEKPMLWSGITSIVVTNIIVIVYIVLAFGEDSSATDGAAAQKKAS